MEVWLVVEHLRWFEVGILSFMSTLVIHMINDFMLFLLLHRIVIVSQSNKTESLQNVVSLTDIAFYKSTYM